MPLGAPLRPPRTDGPTAVRDRRERYHVGNPRLPLVKNVDNLKLSQLHQLIDARPRNTKEPSGQRKRDPEELVAFTVSVASIDHLGPLAGLKCGCHLIVVVYRE